MGVIATAEVITGAECAGRPVIYNQGTENG